MNTPKFKKMSKSNLVLKNQVKLEEFDIKTFGKGLNSFDRPSFKF